MTKSSAPRPELRSDAASGGTLAVLGLDPGSRVTGWGVVEARGRRLAAVAWGVVRCPRNEPLARRLTRLHAGIRDVRTRFPADESAAESVFSAASVGSALTLGQARGAVLAALDGLELSEYAPRAVKKALTGYGAAGKPAVAAMVAQRLGLEAPPEPADAADALAVAVCHLDARRAARRLAGRRGPAR